MGIVKTGLNRWRVVARIRKNGRIAHKQETLEGTKERAKSLLEDFKQELRGKKGAGSLTIIKTFGDALQYYIERHEIGKSLSCFNRLKTDLGNVLIEDLSWRFDQYLLLIKKSKAMRTGKLISNGTRNRYLAWAKASLNFCILNGYLKDNPLRHFQKLREIRRDRILTDEERERLLNILEIEQPHLLPAVRFALQVPVRTNEIINLRREHLNLIKNTLTVPAEFSKNGEPIVKAIPPDMKRYFHTLPPETKYLFYRKESDGYHGLGCFKKSWRHALASAGIKDFVFHDLRHYAVTSLRNAGTPDQSIHMMAGWKNGDYMMKTYYGFREEKLLDLVRFNTGCDSSVIVPEVKIG